MSSCSSCSSSSPIQQLLQKVTQPQNQTPLQKIEDSFKIGAGDTKSYGAKGSSGVVDVSA